MKESKCLEGLNPQQYLAATTIEGSVQIDAVAGSGKTKTIVARIGYMLEQGIKPQGIMLTTFTKQATLEMTDRLSKVISKMQLSQITIGTTHSIGFRILKKEYENLNHPLSSAFKRRDGVLMNYTLKIFAEKIKEEIMKDRTVEFTVKEELRDIKIPQLMKAIGLSKSDDIGSQEYEQLNTSKGSRMQAYVEFYNRYEQTKFSNKCIDADDMLYLLVKLFEEHPDILKKYQGLYKYIMVDESQDCNNSQYKLIRMLSAPEHNLFVVGDIDQSMYSFRGAQPKQFLEFSKNYRNVKSIPLENNYRSNPQILTVANSLIVNNTERLPKLLKAHKHATEEKVVSYCGYENEDSEAKDTVKEIRLLVDREGYNCKDISVLYRTNAQSRSLEDNLIMSGLPYVIHGGISFYERKEVKDLISYLQLIANENDDKSFKRVINVPSRFLGRAFMEKVNDYDGSNWQAITGGITFSKDYERNGSQQFVDLVSKLKEMTCTGSTPTELINYLLDEGGYRDYILGDEEDEVESSRMENIDTLQFVLSRYKNIEDFLDYITRMTSTAKQDIDGVQLMTIHKSKGLEFPVAFIVGASEGILPHFKSIEDSKSGVKPLAIEEERRLMYVAVTRAESLCYVSSINSFNGKPQKPSRFIHEMSLQPKEIDELATDIPVVRTPIKIA